MPHFSETRQDRLPCVSWNRRVKSDGRTKELTHEEADCYPGSDCNHANGQRESTRILLLGCSICLRYAASLRNARLSVISPLFQRATERHANWDKKNHTSDHCSEGRSPNNARVCVSHDTHHESTGSRNNVSPTRHEICESSIGTV